MATIKVQGNATRIFWNGRGVEITEEYKTLGENGNKVIANRKYTAWFDDAVTFPLNTFGTFEGNLSATIEKWVKDEQPVIDKRTGEQGVSIKLAINGATFTGNATAAPTSPASFDDAMPF